MPDETPRHDDTVYVKDGGMVATGVRWLFGQDKPTILLIMILGGVGTGVYFLGKGVIFGVPEWLAGIRAGYKEAIVEFRAESKEQRDQHERQFSEMKATFEKVHSAAEARYQSLVEGLLEMKKTHGVANPQSINQILERDRMAGVAAKRAANPKAEVE